MNLYYEALIKRLVCDPDPEATEYEFCVAPAGTEDWDSLITPVNYRSVAEKSGNQSGKAKSKKNGEWGVYCDPIEFTVS